MGKNTLFQSSNQIIFWLVSIGYRTAAGFWENFPNTQQESKSSSHVIPFLWLKYSTSLKTPASYGMWFWTFDGWLVVPFKWQFYGYTSIFGHKYHVCWDWLMVDTLKTMFRNEENSALFSSRDGPDDLLKEGARLDGKKRQQHHRTGDFRGDFMGFRWI